MTTVTGGAGDVFIDYMRLANYRDAWLSIAVNDTADVEGSQAASDDDWDESVAEEVHNILLRAAAFETGAVENMYQASPGATMSVAEEKQGWEIALDAAGAGARRAFDDQYAAYLAVYSHAKNPTYPIGTSLLSQLHALACENQQTLMDGRAFMHGQFKSTNNYTQDRFGRLKAYCPFELVESELLYGFDLYKELVELNSPLVNSAYLHWMITHVHPYQDGNGRVARILASAPVLAAHGVPIMVFADQKQTYFQALDQGDSGNFGAIVDYTRDRVFDAGRWAKDLRSVRGVGRAKDHYIRDINAVLAAQEEPAEPAEVIVARVLRVVGERISSESKWVEEIGGTFQLRRKNPANFVGNGTATDTTTVLYSVTEPIGAKVAIELSVMINAQPPNDVGVYTGSLSGAQKLLALRYADCTPVVSTEAHLVIAGFVDVFVRDVAKGMSRQITQTSRARGTLPNGIGD
jgi:hypothetical protein